MLIDEGKEDTLLDTLPFTIEEETDHIKLVSKKGGRVSTNSQRLSGQKRVIVEVHLFDRRDVDRLDAINVDPPKKAPLLDRIVRHIK